MGKMVNKDSLEFLRKMASEGNITSKLKEGITPVASEIDKLPSLPSKAIKAADSMSADKHLAKKLALKSMGKGLLKGAGKVAAFGMPLIGATMEAADAAPLGPEEGSMQERLESGTPMREMVKEDDKEAMFKRLREESLARAARARANNKAGADREAILGAIDASQEPAVDQISEEAERAAEVRHKKQQILRGLRRR